MNHTAADKYRSVNVEGKSDCNSKKSIFRETPGLATTLQLVALAHVCAHQESHDMNIFKPLL